MNIDYTHVNANVNVYIFMEKYLYKYIYLYGSYLKRCIWHVSFIYNSLFSLYKYNPALTLHNDGIFCGPVGEPQARNKI